MGKTKGGAEHLLPAFARGHLSVSGELCIVTNVPVTGALLLALITLSPEIGTRLIRMGVGWRTASRGRSEDAVATANPQRRAADTAEQAESSTGARGAPWKLKKKFSFLLRGKTQHFQEGISIPL